MIFVRFGLLVALLIVAILALTQRTPTPVAATVPVATEVVLPTPAPTRVPLPTLGPPRIISRTAQETPTPRPTATPDAVPRVAVVDNGYAPASLTVHPGTTIMWANVGGDGHDVTGRGPDGTWRSGPLAPGERYQRTFWQAGTYDYVCTVHPEMRGQLLVQP